jgi:hypothetical protein
MILLLFRRPVFFLEADGTGAGSTPPAAPPAAPAKADPPPPAAPPQGDLTTPEEDAEWKGWWGAQLTKETREKHKDGLLELKGKQLGEVFDDYFGSRTRLQNAVVFPGKNATPEEIGAFLKRMDIPGTADDYGLDPKMIPGADTDEAKTAAAKGLADFFKSIGLTKNQAKQTFERYTGIIKDADESEATRRKALSDTFEERLLKDVGDKKAAAETTEYYKRALIALGDKQLVQELSQSGMMYSTAFVKGLADIWKAGNQDPPIPQGGGGNDTAAKDALPKGKAFEERYGSRRT